MDFTSYVPIPVIELCAKCRAFLDKEEDERAELLGRLAEEFAERINKRWWRCFLRMEKWTVEDALNAKDSFGLPLINYPYDRSGTREVERLLKAIENKNPDAIVYVSHHLAALL